MVVYPGKVLVNASLQTAPIQSCSTPGGSDSVEWFQGKKPSQSMVLRKWVESNRP